MANCIQCGTYVPGDKGAKTLCFRCRGAQDDAEKLTRLQIKNEKKRQREGNSDGGTRLHGLYCLLVGWWLAMILSFCIVPLFFPGGRRLIKKVFGIWWSGIRDRRNEADDFSSELLVSCHFGCWLRWLS